MRSGPESGEEPLAVPVHHSGSLRFPGHPRTRRQHDCSRDGPRPNHRRVRRVRVRLRVRAVAGIEAGAGGARRVRGVLHGGRGRVSPRGGGRRAARAGGGRAPGRDLRRERGRGVRRRGRAPRDAPELDAARRREQRGRAGRARARGVAGRGNVRDDDAGEPVRGRAPHQQPAPAPSQVARPRRGRGQHRGPRRAARERGV